MYALINTVTPSPVIKRAAQPGDPNPAKGCKWIPDNPPAFDPTKQTRSEVSPVPVDAQEVPYVVADISLVDVKAARRAALKTAFDARGKALVSSYAESERETWPEQVRAAKAYQADPNGTHTYLSGLAKQGETLADVAANILAKRDAFLAASAPLIKNRRALEQAIDDATTVDAVLAVDLNGGWPF